MRVSCSNIMSGCLCSIGAIKRFLLQWNPWMFQKTIVRSCPNCPLLSLVCLEWVLRLLSLFVVFVFVWLTAASLPGLSSGPGSIRPLLEPWLGPPLPLPGGSSESC